jgi:gluconokinase
VVALVLAARSGRSTFQPAPAGTARGRRGTPARTAGRSGCDGREGKEALRERPLALGLDIGTGSIRAFLYDARGTRHGGVRLPYEWRITRDDGVEMDADALVALVHAAISGALTSLPAGTHEVAAVGISALWHTLLGVNADGTPATPAYAWSDMRAARAARALRERLDERAVHARTGGMLHPSYPVARLAWLREADPAAFDRVAWWMSVPEYVWYRLTGERCVGLSIAAGSGLLDQLTLDWDRELLDAVGVRAEQLSPMPGADGALARPRTPPSDGPHWRPLHRALWRLPVGDGACANIGSGCTAPDRMALTIGTSAAARTVLPWPHGVHAPHGLWLYRLDASNAVLGGAISNGGLVRRWLRRTLRLPDDEAELDSRLAARPPAAHGLAVLPFLAGERSPEWPLDATAVFAGIRQGTGPLDILQAGMEAVAYRLAMLRGLILGRVPEARTIVASGAALQKSPYWARLVADVFGEPLLVAEEEEASSRGAAMLAFIAAGELGGLHDVPVPAVVHIEPDPDRHAVHAEAMARHILLARNHARHGP